MLHAALSGIGFDPAGRAKLGVAEGTARRGPGGPDVAPGAVSRRTTVAGWPPRVQTPVPAAALKASKALDGVRVGDSRSARTAPEIPPEVEALIEQRRRLGHDRHDEVWEDVYLSSQLLCATTHVH